MGYDSHEQGDRGEERWEMQLVFELCSHVIEGRVVAVMVAFPHIMIETAYQSYCHCWWRMHSCLYPGTIASIGCTVG